MNKDFIPGTMPRKVAPNIFFRPIRSWHSATYAGEGLTSDHGDRSGCVIDTSVLLPMCHVPKTVTHRVYWNDQTDKRMSSFLSYPNAMGCEDNYFWEVYPVDDDIARFPTEEEMEAFIITQLSVSA